MSRHKRRVKMTMVERMREYGRAVAEGRLAPPPVITLVGVMRDGLLVFVPEEDAHEEKKSA
jgi:hypothetical protein